MEASVRGGWYWDKCAPPPPEFPWAPLNKDLMGTRAGLDFCRRTNVLPLPGVDPRFLDRLARRLVAVVTELSRLPNENITITWIRVLMGFMWLRWRPFCWIFRSWQWAVRIHGRQWIAGLTERWPDNMECGALPPCHIYSMAFWA
jgi:hypothetical protein